jgi:hypothetical protein
MIQNYADYAAQWGCDPVYDKAPRLPGDGYLFYNFAIEMDDPVFRAKFIPAIERTISGCNDENDVEELNDLLEYVKNCRIGVPSLK